RTTGSKFLRKPARCTEKRTRTASRYLFGRSIEAARELESRSSRWLGEDRRAVVHRRERGPVLAEAEVGEQLVRGVHGVAADAAALRQGPAPPRELVGQ